MSAEPVDQAAGRDQVVVDRHALLEAVGATRALAAALRVADAPTDVLARVAALASEAAELLAPHRVEAVRQQGSLHEPEPGARPDGFDTAGRPPDDPAVFFPYSPILGPLNPVAAPVAVRFDGERVRGTATFDARWVGPPDMVHGGVIALLFDEVLGVANVCGQAPGFTGTLTVRYERPTPLDEELHIEARVEEVKGRKVITRGTISHDGQVTARAEGVFIRADI